MRIVHHKLLDEKDILFQGNNPTGNGTRTLIRFDTNTKHFLSKWKYYYHYVVISNEGFIFRHNRHKIYRGEYVEFEFYTIGTILLNGVTMYKNGKTIW